MVYDNHIAANDTFPGYRNEQWRVRHGYKELEVADPPFRRNRDFKPLSYGSYRGILNYRHSEPFMHLKNLKDLWREPHHHPTKWFKSFLKGALWGGSLGYMYTVFGPTGNIENEKMMSTVAHRYNTGRLLR